MSNKYSRNKMAKICYLYYKQSLTQREIAKYFGVSSNTISRILDEAKKNNIIKFDIDYKFPRNSKLEKIAEKIYSSISFVILQDNFLREVNSEKMKKHKYLGEAGAYYLPTILDQKDRMLGVTGGRTLAKLARSLEEGTIKHVNNIIQVTGGEFESGYEKNSTTVLQLICEKLDKTGFYFHAPAYIPPDRGGNSIFSQHKEKIRDKWRRLDLVLVGIGSFSKNSTTLTSGLFSKETIKELSSKGAIGEIGLHFFNKDGNLVSSKVDSGVQGIEWERLKKIPKVIAIAGGSEKGDAIKGAINSNSIDVLITLESNIKSLINID